MTPDDVPHPVATVHNAAVARLDHGRAVLVLRSHVATGHSILGHIDDLAPAGAETDADVADRKKFLRTIGCKL